MSYKRRPICGINISRYYLDADMISVATMTVSKSKEGRQLWITLPDVKVFDSMEQAIVHALALAIIHDVEICFELHKGEEVTYEMHKHLLERGLLDHLL